MLSLFVTSSVTLVTRWQASQFHSAAAKIAKPAIFAYAVAVKSGKSQHSQSANSSRQNPTANSFAIGIITHHPLCQLCTVCWFRRDEGGQQPLDPTAYVIFDVILLRAVCQLAQPAGLARNRAVLSAEVQLAALCPIYALFVDSSQYFMF